MKKFFVIFLTFFLFSPLIIEKIYAQQAGQIIPQKGINCGKAFDDTKNKFNPNEPKNQEYKCCYTPIEEVGQIDPNVLKGFPVPGVDALFSAIIGFINNRIDAIPWFLFPDPIPKLLPSVGTFRSGIKDYYVNNTCVDGAAPYPVGSRGKPNCYCKANTPPALSSLTIFCNNMAGPDCKLNPTNNSEKCRCTTCVEGGGVWTALGCVKSNLTSFITETVMGLGISLAGIFALICIIYAAFQMQTSGGNPERIKKAQELLTSCIMGLMLIIFSVFILRLIGVDILKIPGFSK